MIGMRIHPVIGEVILRMSVAAVAIAAAVTLSAVVAAINRGKRSGIERRD